MDHPYHSIKISYHVRLRGMICKEKVTTMVEKREGRGKVNDIFDF